MLIHIMSLRHATASGLAYQKGKPFMGSYLKEYSSKQQLVVCIHTADLLLIEFLVHTKTSGISSGMNTLTSYSIVDCLQNLHMQDSYVW